jgi:hypothetical protein
MKEEFCRICGFTGGCANDWYIATKCRECTRKKRTLKNSLAKSVWGYVCEDYNSGMSKKALSQKYAITASVIDVIIRAYLGIGESPILLSFIPDEEVVKNVKSFDFAPGDWVRVTKIGTHEYMRIKQVAKITESGKILLKHSGNTNYSKFHLEKYEMKESRSFNV